ncbi:hypothetical protein ACIQZI_08625 [Peribacillus sp. NPDC096379]|uniref:hypothetical protein n=1 Tax=Peribacillus sp. NPDC096379 TaxID=3364393 RepID=UPI00382D423B
MSVISESQVNDKIIIIEPFTTCRDGIEFNWEEARDFKIGESVYYLDGFKDPDSPFSQDHLSWMTRFKTGEGQVFTATQHYFVTNEAWNSLKSFFENQFGLRVE